MMEPVPDLYGLVANVESDHVFRTGALVWILHCDGDAEIPLCLGLSKGGRKVRKRIPYKRLRNFRAKWIPPKIRDECHMTSPDRAVMEKSAKTLGDMWSGIQYFHRDGTLLKPGDPASEAFKK